MSVFPKRKKITTDIYIVVNGEIVSRVGRRDVLLDKGSDQLGTLRDGRRVYKKDGKWLYVPANPKGGFNIGDTVLVKGTNIVGRVLFIHPESGKVRVKEPQGPYKYWSPESLIKVKKNPLLTIVPANPRKWGPRGGKQHKLLARYVRRHGKKFGGGVRGARKAAFEGTMKSLEHTTRALKKWGYGKKKNPTMTTEEARKFNKIRHDDPYSYPPVPVSAKLFQHNYGWEKPIKIHEWEWSTTFGKWSALVTFKDGWHGWTYPKTHKGNPIKYIRHKIKCDVCGKPLRGRHGYRSGSETLCRDCKMFTDKQMKELSGSTRSGRGISIERGGRGLAKQGYEQYHFGRGGYVTRNPATVSLECLECGKKFKSTSDDPRCPSCGSVDFEVASVSEPVLVGRGGKKYKVLGQTENYYLLQEIKTGRKYKMMRKNRQNPRGEVDQSYAREIYNYARAQFADTPQELVFIKNMMGKIARGVYNREKGARLYYIMAKQAWERYKREHGVSTFHGLEATLMEVGRWLEDEYYDRAEGGQYDSFMSKKYQKKNPRTKSRYSAAARKLISDFMRRKAKGKKLTRKQRGRLLGQAMGEARKKHMKLPAKPNARSKQASKALKKLLGKDIRFVGGSKQRRKDLARYIRAKRKATRHRSGNSAGLRKIYGKLEAIITDKGTFRPQHKTSVYGDTRNGRRVVLKGEKWSPKLEGAKVLTVEASENQTPGVERSELYYHNFSPRSKVKLVKTASGGVAIVGVKKLWTPKDAV